MGPIVAYRLRAEVRHRWPTLLWLVVLVAVLGGIVVATAAGSRRTASAYTRLLAETNPPELLVSPPGGPGFDPTPFYDAVARTAGVRRVAAFAGIPLLPLAGTPSERLAEPLTGLGVLAALDGPPGTEVGRPLMVAGRLPDGGRADEILVTERMADAADISVGDVIDAVVVRSTDALSASGVATAQDGIPVRLTVTGIGVVYDEVVPFSDLNASGSIMATPALAALLDRSEWNFEGALVDVEPGTDLELLSAAIEQLGLDGTLGTGGPVFISNQVVAAETTNDAVRPLAVALALASVAIGFVTVLVVAQAVSRVTRRDSHRLDTLRALGARRIDDIAFATARAAVVGAAGAVGAIAVAVALSGQFPIGIARAAEPHPGIRADTTVLLGGAVAIVALTAGSALPAATLALRRPARRARSVSLAATAASSGLSPAAVQGVRFAAGGGARRPIPMRSTLVAVSVAITSVVATVSFAASMAALIDTPARYGQGWDRMVDAQFGPAPVRTVVERFEGFEGVRGIAAGNYGTVAVNGVQVPAFDLRVVSGDVSIGILDGRPATGADEIVLGSEIIDRLDLRLGDSVAVDIDGERRSMRLSGRGVFPQMGQGSFSTTALGDGAQLAGDTFVSFGDFEVPADYELDDRRYNFVVIDTDQPASSLDRALTEIEAAAVADQAFVFVRREQPPNEIRDLERVRVVPGAMAGVLALVAVAALAHLLITSVRERRRELALLRTLGFSGRQLHASVGWQASVITVTALAVATPVGLALGRFVWQRFADRLDAAAPVETPWLGLLLALVATLLLANAVAAVPGRLAARTPPAGILRDE